MVTAAWFVASAQRANRSFRVAFVAALAGALTIVWRVALRELASTTAQTPDTIDA